MKILKKPKNKVVCSLCGCKFEFASSDVKMRSGGTHRRMEIDPHYAVDCPGCGTSIKVWDKNKAQEPIYQVICNHCRHEIEIRQGKSTLRATNLITGNSYSCVICPVCNTLVQIGE
jgi:transcription elongation factor Elf1